MTSQTGNINVKAAEQQQKIDEQKTALTVNGYAKEAGDKQYRAGLRIEHTRDSEKPPAPKTAPRPSAAAA